MLNLIQWKDYKHYNNKIKLVKKYIQTILSIVNIKIKVTNTNYIQKCNINKFFRKTTNKNF